MVEFKKDILGNQKKMSVDSGLIQKEASKYDNFMQGKAKIGTQNLLDKPTINPWLFQIQYTSGKTCLVENLLGFYLLLTLLITTLQFPPPPKAFKTHLFCFRKKNLTWNKSNSNFKKQNKTKLLIIKRCEGNKYLNGEE